MDSAEDFVAHYLKQVLPLFEEYRSKALKSALSVLEKAYLEEKTVYVCGNGGSAGTASHMVNDLSKGTCVEGKKRLRVLGLADNRFSIRRATETTTCMR